MNRLYTTMFLLCWTAVATGADCSVKGCLLFSFESGETNPVVLTGTQKTICAEEISRFATDGNRSLRLSAEPWRKGLASDSMFNLAVPTNHADWSKHQRIVFDVFNAGSAGRYLRLNLMSATNNASRLLILPEQGWKRFSFWIEDFARGVLNIRQIKQLQFYLYQRTAALNIYVDNIRLVAEGEVPAPPSESFRAAAAAYTLSRIPAAREALGREEETHHRRHSPFLSALGMKLDRAETRLRLADCQLEEINDLAKVISDFPERVTRTRALHRLVEDCTAAGQNTTNGFAATIVSSLEKVPPRFGFVPEFAPTGNGPEGQPLLELARNEKEALQVVVLPTVRPLKQTCVVLSTFTNEQGVVWPTQRITSELVGFVKTREAPVNYRVEAVGWWPDPILPFLHEADVELGDIQTFWIRASAPSDLAAGIYRGNLSVRAEGCTPITLPLAIRVYPFTLPDMSELPLAIVFEPTSWPPWGDSRLLWKNWENSSDTPTRTWLKHKQEWIDFLADYLIPYDNIYRQTPDFEAIRYLKKKGRLGLFNLGAWDDFPDTEESRAKWKTNTLARIRKSYLQAQGEGVLDHAYLYGCDEVVAERFPRIKEAVALLHKACPGVPIFTTAFDKELGREGSDLSGIDWFCPTTSDYRFLQAEAARKNGKKVWWYIACNQTSPAANAFVEYSPLELRSLMGAQAGRCHPDGFLYYQTTIWQTTHPIISGPFTDWNIATVGDFHGDGQWICAGPDGTPVPTIRLENFRDGLEDYAYVTLLRKKIADFKTHSSESWRREAEAVAAVPDSVVRDYKHFSHNPAVLLAWRQRIAQILSETVPDD